MAKRTVQIQGSEVVDSGTIDLDLEDVRQADGSRLTEDGAAELAQEVLRRVGRGRPSLTSPGRRSPQLRVSIPQQTQTKLRQRADAEHRTVSEVAREALERYLAS